VADLIPHQLTEWADRHNDWSPTTRFNYIRAVPGAFRWAIRQRLITSNPVEYVEKPTPECREIIISGEQWDSILACYSQDDPFHDLLVFARLSGARPQESKKIEARHLQQDQRVAVFLKSESKKKGKRKRNRVLYLPPPLRPMLQRLCEMHPEGPIFRNKDGNPWTTNAIRSRFRRVRKILDIEQLFMYAIRHTWETNMLLEQPLQLVAELAGHDPKTAMSNYHHPQGLRSTDRPDSSPPVDFVKGRTIRFSRNLSRHGGESWPHLPRLRRDKNGTCPFPSTSPS
jgi:integrase